MLEDAIAGAVSPRNIEAFLPRQANIRSGNRSSDAIAVRATVEN
jgi:hypothetical protein